MTAQVPHETIAFAAGQCVGYLEDFDDGRGNTGPAAYTCHLTITAPAFELRAGGPALPLAPAAARLWAERTTETPTPGLSSAPGSMAKFVRTVETVTLSPALLSMLDSTLLVASSAGPDGPTDFDAFVKADLQGTYNTPTGKKLLESLHASGRRIYINYGAYNTAAFPYNLQHAFLQSDGVTPGQGATLSIEYNPLVDKTGPKEWNQRPPAIGLAHELIHAEQAAYGRMRRGKTDNPGGLDETNPLKPRETPVFELETIGIPPHDAYSLTENKIRAEWNPPQIRRTYY